MLYYSSVPRTQELVKPAFPGAQHVSIFGGQSFLRADLLRVEWRSAHSNEGEEGKAKDNGRKAWDEGHRSKGKGRRTKDDGRRVKREGRRAKGHRQKAAKGDRRRAKGEGQRVKDEGCRAKGESIPLTLADVAKFFRHFFSY